MSARQRDLLLTAVFAMIALTPAWLLPVGWSQAWQLAVVVLAIPALWFSWTHAPWQPTPLAEQQRILRLLDLDATERFCDLGAGDGRVLAWVQAATGAECVGLEASPAQWLIAKARLLGTPKARVRLADIYAADLDEFDALYVWGTGYSVGTDRFAQLFERLRPGARLVSYHTPVPGVEPDAVDDSGQRPLYLYVR